MWESCEDRKVFILIEESMKMKNQNITYHFDPPPSSSSSSHYARYSPFSHYVKRALHSTDSSCHVASYCFSYSPKIVSRIRTVSPELVIKKEMISLIRGIVQADEVPSGEYGSYCTYAPSIPA
jgi:hypothetical protein